MKKTFFTVMLAAGMFGAFGQVTNIFPNSGKVGVGTTTPLYNLEVRGGSTLFRLVSSNSTVPEPSIDLYDNVHGTEFILSPSAGKVDMFTYSNHPLSFGTGATEKMRIAANGNVGIGTVDPGGYKLAVNGKIRAQEIKVEALPWPDYVFAKDYLLPTLQETEKHIKEKGHLPGIPSAKEVKADGIDLGEMNAKLLQKIEELTLHLINLSNVVSKQQIEISQLKNK